MFFALMLVLTQLFGSYVVAQEDLDISAVVGGPPAPGGGGGSTGSGSVTYATVVLSGSSFPNAKITLLKDGAVATNLFANPDGSFQITINNLHFGNYQLALIAEDGSGNFTSPYALNVAVFSNQPYLFAGIVMPPTLSISSTLIPVGSNFVASGYSVPFSTVTLEVPGGLQFGTAVAAANGYYEIEVRASVPPNLYSLRAMATFNGTNSPYSRPVQVLVYSGQLPTPGQPAPPSQFATCVDYNKDRRVNLIDFSILLFWFGKDMPPKTIDCNSDGVIDLKDFSILMYFWTG